jgi:hypothetical protein
MPAVRYQCVCGAINAMSDESCSACSTPNTHDRAVAAACTGGDTTLMYLNPNGPPWGPPGMGGFAPGRGEFVSVVPSWCECEAKDGS